MRRHLNTLFVTTQGTYLYKEGETVAVKPEDGRIMRVPVHTLGGIVCFGRISMSPQLMGFCAQKDVAITFLSETGYFLAKVQGYTSGNVLLRRTQYRWADDTEKSIVIAKDILLAKFINSRAVLNRALRDHSDKIDAEAVRRAVLRMTWSIKKLGSMPMRFEELRGLEGDTAHSYFQVFEHLIVAQKDGFSFRGRSRRPPMDNVNCLLSFLYTLLLHDVRAGLESVGLDSSVGFLHRDRPGRPSLALDLMEELRAYLADRLALTLINLGQVQPSGFKRMESGGVSMDDETRKIVLTAYQNRKREEITHPFLNERMSIGLLFFVQALLLSRYLRGDLDGYPAFMLR